MRAAPTATFANADVQNTVGMKLGSRIRRQSNALITVGDRSRQRFYSQGDLTASAEL